MIIKDKKLAAMIENANLIELPYRLDVSGTEEDMQAEGLTEWGYVARECNWIIEDYTCNWGGHPLYDDLKHARWLLKRTDNGKRIPISTATFRPLIGYWPNDIEYARQTIADYNSTKAFAKKLAKAIAKRDEAKQYKLGGTVVKFWKESGTVFCKVEEMGADVYVCKTDTLPLTKAEALALTKTAWLW